MVLAWVLFMLSYLRMRKRARGALSPDMEPYSRLTRDTRRHRPNIMSMYLVVVLVHVVHGEDVIFSIWCFLHYDAWLYL